MNLTSPAVAEVLDEWVHGWAVSRRVPRPSRLPVGFHLHVGTPGHRERYVLPRLEDLAAVAAMVTRTDTWIKVCAPREAVRAALSPAWTLDIPGHLMTTTLRSSAVRPVPEPYRLESTVDGELLRVVVRTAGGELAASGQAGLAGSSATMDKIVTEPAHQRRGLGSVVMDALREQAIAAGAVRGVLVATDDGFALYSRLGWTLIVPVTGVHLVESAAE
ncbi:GNAT family N-acetyltransferase [Amycolatopsis magusensis]|uniref:GNAT family N-acetyltransferase n=1 Tax=Amycolatopsis magusensis TaxID=882444 RepID=UPI003C2D9EB5